MARLNRAMLVPRREDKLKRVAAVFAAREVLKQWELRRERVSRGSPRAVFSVTEGVQILFTRQLITNDYPG